MSKFIKLISVSLMILMMTMTLTTNVYAEDHEITTYEGSTEAMTLEGGEDSTDSEVKPSKVLGDLQTQTNEAAKNINTNSVAKLGGRVLRFIQYVAVIGGAILLAVLGVKYMMGSVEEKAEYKKSFIPLVVGIIVVMGAISIATFLFDTFAIF